MKPINKYILNALFTGVFSTGTLSSCEKGKGNSTPSRSQEDIDKIPKEREKKDLDVKLEKFYKAKATIAGGSLISAEPVSEVSPEPDKSFKIGKGETYLLEVSLKRDNQTVKFRDTKELQLKEEALNFNNVSNSLKAGNDYILAAIYIGDKSYILIRTYPNISTTELMTLNIEIEDKKGSKKTSKLEAKFKLK